ncbi:Bone morphoproteintic protein 1 [Sparganum proliferum]
MKPGLLVLFVLAVAFAMRTRVELRSTSQNTLDAEVPASEDAKRRSRRAATSLKSHIWPSGIIPYEIGPQFSSSSRTIIFTAMRMWEEVTRVNIWALTNSFIVEPGEYERNRFFMFDHDQYAYVEILTENIKSDSLYNYKKKDQHEVDSLGEPYDYDSIMHYAKNLFAKPGATETLRPRECCPRPEIGHLSKPSAGDVRQMNKLYSCPSCGQTFLDHSATFASPKAQASYAGASGGLDNTEMSTQTLPFQDQTQILSSHSATSDSVFCSWRIIAASGERIQLTFTHMDMLPPTNLSQSVERKPAHSSSCISEYVEARDGYHSGSPLIGRYCGNTLPNMLLSSSSRMVIEYVRSAGQSGTGFEATYQVVCGEIMRAEEGIFTSPGYPDIYPPNRECTWRIEVPVGFAVLLTFYSFDLEGGENCQFDYLDIFDGSSALYLSLDKLCGVKLPEPIRSTGNTMTVRFVTDAGVQKQGFEARFQKVSYAEKDNCVRDNHDCEQVCINISGGYKCQCYDGYNLLPDEKTCQPLACGDYLRKGSGYITSPGFPKEYPPNSRCIWRIEVPSGFFVVLKFSRFELEDQFDCPYDYLEIYDGPLDPSSMLRKLCGTLLPEPVNSTSNVMTLKFVTDNAFHKKGFKVRHQLGTPPRKRLRSVGRQ